MNRSAFEADHYVVTGQLVRETTLLMLHSKRSMKISVKTCWITLSKASTPASSPVRVFSDYAIWLAMILTETYTQMVKPEAVCMVSLSKTSSSFPFFDRQIVHHDGVWC